MTNLPKPNTPLVTHIFTADPSAHVFEGKVYIYPSHDLDHDGPDNDNGDQYAMEDYHVLSLDDFKSPVVDHGQVLHLKDIPWASKQLWAPDASYKNGIYYLFFPARDHEGIFRIGVATSASPAGPFLPQPDYIEGSFSIDPAVFVDDDDQAYIFFGGLWGGQLEKWQSGTFEPRAEGPAAGTPALGPKVALLSEDMMSFQAPPTEISIVDEAGQPILADDEDRRYFEGPWVHKYNDWYYLSYSTGTTHKLVYAVSRNPMGPYTFKGTILTPVVGWTTHHSIVQFKEKWYLFYHDSSLSGGVNHKRCLKYTELHYNEDGTIRMMDPYESHKLHEVFKDHFMIGAAVNSKTLDRQRELLTSHFNSVTAENEMKFERLHPAEDQYTFEHADRLVAFAKEYGMGVRGHTLVWHNQTPDWMFENRAGGVIDRETLLLRMKSHIETVVTRYKGTIYAWDVVNEAVSDSGDELLRKSKWLDIIGEDFIAKAFEYAHAADPGALLFYNDYNESVPQKREKIYTLVKSLKEQGVPIHGIGLQAHWNLEHPSIDDIREAIERYASLGMKLHITELDVSVFKHDDRRTDLLEPTEEMLMRQAERYQEFFRLFMEYSDVITSVTFWGAADDYTWLDNFPVRGRKNWPFLFDTQHKPKSSYWNIMNVARI